MGGSMRQHLGLGFLLLGLGLLGACMHPLDLGPSPTVTPTATPLTGCFNPVTVSPGVSAVVSLVPCNNFNSRDLYRSHAELAAAESACGLTPGPDPCDFSAKMLFCDVLTEDCNGPYLHYTQVCYFSDHVELTLESDSPAHPPTVFCNSMARVAIWLVLPRSPLPLKVVTVNVTY